MQSTGTKAWKLSMVGSYNRDTCIKFTIESFKQNSGASKTIPEGRSELQEKIFYIGTCVDFLNTRKNERTRLCETFLKKNKVGICGGWGGSCSTRDQDLL